MGKGCLNERGFLFVEHSNHNMLCDLKHLHTAIKGVGLSLTRSLDAGKWNI